MNNLDKQYTELLQDILDNGHQKGDRTGTGTISVFGRQIRHKMSDGFPLLTTKKMYMKGIITELIWFLRGDTNIKFLVDNDCHIWDGDAYKNWKAKGRDFWEEQVDGMFTSELGDEEVDKISKEWFINKIKTDDEFAKKWGELGPCYGKQWRKWSGIDRDAFLNTDNIKDPLLGGRGLFFKEYEIDQLANAIEDLKTNPDSRRIIVSAWNVGEIDQMTLPPCHNFFQFYTRELSREERYNLMPTITGHSKENIESRKKINNFEGNTPGVSYHEEWLDSFNIPTRAISLMWNQRSVDTFLGLPFNIASYGLLLEIIAKAVNMVPDELIGNLGDTHLYSNHIEQAKEQIGRELTFEERRELMVQYTNDNNLLPIGHSVPFGEESNKKYLAVCDKYGIPKRTREPYPLPTLNINTEFWPYEGGECGVGPLDAIKVFESFSDDNFCRCLLEEDIQLSNYQSHPTIKAPLSN